MAIIGDTYLPMSDFVRFPETYLIKDVPFWQRYLPLIIICFWGFPSINSWSKLLFCSYFSVQTKWHFIFFINSHWNSWWQKSFFSFWFLKNRMSVFWRHTYLPCPIMSDFAWDTYLLTQKSDIFYERSLMKN